MQKINFQNLPNTTTPVNASNLNDLQTNVENAINGVVESGSNSNGNYIKFDDGTLICWKKETVNTQIGTAWGVLYESDSPINLGSFPVSFISTPIVMGTCISQRSAFIESIYSISTTSWGTTYLVRPQQQQVANNYDISLTAIGRWK